MGNRVLDSHSVILLDMNGTFMFGEDRFGNDEDFHQTYRNLGGSQLDRATVDHGIRRTLRNMFIDYEDPSKLEDFAPLLDQVQRAVAVDLTEAVRLEAVIAHHECGRVSNEDAACLRALSRTHPLGVVSNIWAKKDIWLREFERAAIADIWTARVFSSDYRFIKPSPRLFELAIAQFDAPIARILYVGDSLRADILPAKRLGMTTVWINPARSADASPDYSIASLGELQDLTG